jgi:cyclopropane-fatty-acyl-phospholipid synthase
MFEHMRNWPVLYDRIASWLAPGGRFFQHVFCHREHPYAFEDETSGDWMARNFFSGGIMPSWDLPMAIGGPLEVEASWRVDGRHYARTSRSWLDRLDAHRDELLGVLSEHPDGAVVALERWRLFFMACEELFAHRSGTEWFVGHYRLRSRAS